MHVCYTDRCIYSQGVHRTYQRALERGFGGVGGRFNLYLEYDLEVELILNFFKRLLPTPESHRHATKHLLSTQGSTRAWGRVQLRPQDSQRRQTHVSCRAT